MDIQVVSSLLLLPIIIQSIKFASLHICKCMSRRNSPKVEMLGQRQFFFFFRETRGEYREDLNYMFPGLDGLVMLAQDVSSHAFMLACL